MIDISLVKYLSRNKIIWTIHNLYGHELFFPKLEKLIRRHSAKKADGSITHCNRAKKEVQKELGIPFNKKYMIPYGNFITGL